MHPGKNVLCEYTMTTLCARDIEGQNMSKITEQIGVYCLRN